MENKITIACSANMSFAINEIVDAFTEASNLNCEIIISSSGKLTAQIKEGAPFDIFISADMKYPTEIYDSGLAIMAPKVYAIGQLVVWTMYDDVPITLDSLISESIEHIALANPQIAPYGRAALEVLNNLGIRQEINHKLVYGESLSQTNQFIVSRSAEIGITSLSVVLAEHMKNQGSWVQIDSDGHTSIEQGAVLIRQANQDTQQAQKFYDFLFSAKSRQILQNFGYSVDEQTPRSHMQN